MTDRGSSERGAGEEIPLSERERIKLRPICLRKEGAPRSSGGKEGRRIKNI